nr:D-3-phosphoglycerate dehydrogenase [Klebsiella pneumoniae]
MLYTPGRNADAAAELTLGLMLSLARHIPQSHAALKRGIHAG